MRSLSQALCPAQEGRQRRVPGTGFLEQGSSVGQQNLGTLWGEHAVLREGLLPAKRGPGQQTFTDHHLETEAAPEDKGIWHTPSEAQVQLFSPDR